MRNGKSNTQRSCCSLIWLHSTPGQVCFSDAGSVNTCSLLRDTEGREASFWKAVRAQFHPSVRQQPCRPRVSSNQPVRSATACRRLAQILCYHFATWLLRRASENRNTTGGFLSQRLLLPRTLLFPTAYEYGIAFEIIFDHLDSWNLRKADSFDVIFCVIPFNDNHWISFC